ncbi:MAG: hypothetical protein V3T84_03565 [Phycisphaerales bacterium]
MKKTSLLACMAALILLIGGRSTLGANASDDENELISVKFAGGSVTDYVKFLVKEAGTINIVVALEAADVPMPPVMLTKVTVSAAIDLVDGRSTSPPGRFIQLDVRHMPQYAEEELPTYQISADVRRTGRPRPNASVWTIANLVRGEIFDADDVLAAVEAALDILESTGEPLIRFHKETGLLIARGDAQQLSTIEDVLGQLQQSQNLMSRKPMQELHDQNVVLKTELANAKARNIDLTVEWDRARNEARQFRVELEAQMARLAETERMLQQRNREMADLTTLLRQTQASLERERRRSDDERKPGRDNP